MRQALITMILLGILACPVAASEIDREPMMYGVDSLDQALSPSVERIVGEISPGEQPDVNEVLKRIASAAIDGNTSTLRAVFVMIFQIMLIAILCKLISCDDNSSVKRVTVMTGTIAVVLVCISDVSSMIGTSIATMDEIRVFSSALLPVMASAAAGSGAVNGASAAYAVSVLFSNLLITVCRMLLMPAVYFTLALAVTDSVLESQRMKQLREFLGWLIKNGLKWMMYLFTAFLSLSGVLAGSADAMALKAAKMAVSSMVPVVGGIISDAAETVLTGAGFLKNSVGTFGMLSILAIFFIPFLKIGIWLLGFRLVSALCSVVESKLSGCMEAISDVMGFLLAMIGSCSLMNLLACFSFIKTVAI